MNKLPALRSTNAPHGSDRLARTNIWRVGRWATLALIAAPLAHALGPVPPDPRSATQEPSPQEQEEEPTPLEQIENNLGQRDPKQQEMIDLFGEVERNLLAIDDVLFEAAAAEDDLELMESGLSELFLTSRKRSQDVAEGIDRILELAQEMQNQQQNSSSSSGEQSQDQQNQQGQQGQQQQGSPLDGRGQESQREQESSRREAGAPESQPGSGSGQNQAEQPGQGEGGEQPGQGSRPEDAGASDEEGGNQEGQGAVEGALGSGSERGAAGQWGELPPRVQEIFSNQVSDDLPLEYRDFIESYWLRLQREG